MKKIFLLMLTFALVFSVAVFGNKPTKIVNAASELQVSTITTVGNAEVKVTPDIAIFNIGVETINQDASVAERENSEKINAIINTLLNEGVERDSIQTTNYYMHKKYDYQSGQVFVGYQINNNIKFSVSANSNLSTLLSRLTENGITNVNGISFGVSSKSEAYNNALKLALQDAKSKAEALAEGKTLRIISIDENSNCCGIEYARATLYNIDGSSAIQKGEVVVSANVKVEFEII